MERFLGDEGYLNGWGGVFACLYPECSVRFGAGGYNQKQQFWRDRNRDTGALQQHVYNEHNNDGWVDGLYWFFEGAASIINVYMKRMYNLSLSFGLFDVKTHPMGLFLPLLSLTHSDL